MARLAFVFCCALTMGRCNIFQHIFGNQKELEFYGPYFQIMLFLVIMLLVNNCSQSTITQAAFTCLKLTLETLEECVKYVQS